MIQRKPPTPGELLVEIRRYHSGPIGNGRWPTIAQLAAYVRQPEEVIRERVEILLDRRYVVMDGDQVVPWEARPGDLIVRQMTEEERAKYGLPNPRPGRSAPVREDLAPEIQEVQQEVHGEMPTGVRIQWPDDQTFVDECRQAMAEHGHTWHKALAERYECSALTIKVRFREAKERLLSQASNPAPAEPYSSPENATVSPAEAPEQTGQGDDTLQPPVPAAADRTPEQREADADAMPGETMIETGQDLAWVQEAERAASQIAGRPPATATLATHVPLILVDEAADRPAQVRVEYEHVARAPEQVGEEWPELVRVNGLRKVRTWTCVGRVEIAGVPVCVMMPAGTAVVRLPGTERGAA